MFFNEDRSECVAHEKCRGSDALLEHLANLGETGAAILKVCSAEGELRAGKDTRSRSDS